GNPGIPDGYPGHLATLHALNEGGVVQHLLTGLGVDAGGHHIKDPGNHQPQYDVLGHVVQGRPRFVRAQVRILTSKPYTISGATPIDTLHWSVGGWPPVCGSPPGETGSEDSADTHRSPLPETP